MKRKVAILLVEPESPGNIGSVARAMKNMDLEDLRLVKPPAGWKNAGKMMAMSAADLLEKARVFESVEEALNDAVLTIGTTRRTRRHNPSQLLFREALQKIRRVWAKRQVVIMFGKESKGLDNHSLEQCDWVTTIPSSPVYPSVNLAQAVMITAYSLFDASSYKMPLRELGVGGEWVRKGEIYQLLEIWKDSLSDLDYDQEHGLTERILATFHGLFKRSGLLKREEQMFKGVARRIRERTTSKYGKGTKVRPALQQITKHQETNTKE